jgi:integrase
MVSVPPGMSATGKRVRRFFADSKKAGRFAASVRAAHTAGMRGNLIPAELAIQAAEADRILRPLGISLIEAARMAAAADKLEAGAGAEVFRERWLRAVVHGETVWSSRYASDMGKLDRWMGKEAMGLRCRELTEERITQALRENGAKAASTLRLRKRMVAAVLGWTEETAPRPARDIRILSPGECGRVLRACERADERRVVALLLFAGIRPDAESGEISRLDWAAVGAKEIYLDREVSKVGDRHVPITGRLERLLRGRPESGPVVPAGWRRAWQRIRKTAGISEMQDVLRHTFASNYLAAFGEDAAKQAMGHTAGSSTLFRHYRRAVTAEAGRRFFR